MENEKKEEKKYSVKKRYKKDLLYVKIDNDILAEYGIHNAYEKYCGQLTLEDVFTVDSVYLAAKECASGFQSRKDTQAFMQCPWINSLELCERVLSGKFKPKYYRAREITERGKKRIIQPPTFECKVVQKVLCNTILRAVLEYRMIETNYASVRGKGTLKLYQDVLVGINKAKYKFENPTIVMTDYSNFFGSIDNKILKERVFDRYIKDERITKLLDSFNGSGKGLSLGNEVSQVPASFYPSPIDHWIKDRIGLKFYYRYMDDILFVCEKDEGNWLLDGIQERSKELGLTIKDEKIQIVPFGKDFVYCKERYIFNREKRYYYSLVNPAIPRRQAHKIRAFARKVAEGELPIKEAEKIQKSVLGAIRVQKNSFKTVKRLETLYNAEFAKAVGIV